ncbi:membrane protein [Actinoplanes ianthinogenes]|uniref:Membrane protein n=1 Tax=Actinoplanes ianthinogenes TaxID=122358 RepID=A0ABN6C8K6_9ACTN|nr:membrane protein [Actinoplanes ianthinogenes]GGR28121.1 membrane protein [Actinoplanes ianthinogenes]
MTAVAGVVVAAGKWATGSIGAAAVLLVFFLVLAVATSPLVFPRPVTAAATRADSRPVVYWRPGCPYCVRLRTVLGPRADQVQWVDIWQDPEAAAIVRGFADGNETVPTVVIDGEGFVNPSPRWLKEKLQPA